MRQVNEPNPAKQCVPAGQSVQLVTLGATAGAFELQTFGPPGVGWQRQAPFPSSPQSMEEAQAWQIPSAHSALAQSFRLEHVWPLAQRGQGPPQSISVSSPFCFPSAQLGNLGFFFRFLRFRFRLASAASPSTIAKPSAPRVRKVVRRDGVPARARNNESNEAVSKLFSSWMVRPVLVSGRAIAPTAAT